ncbi:hypothetical protein [Morganella morganii IS15]|nr:hypothetical protein CSB69_2889 [Morganella morganii]EMP53065.1 hypothetical protein C790_03041 [Morganella morganii SC01]CDK68281.1 hypothetical protein [Morganella morganii IS15]
MNLRIITYFMHKNNTARHLRADNAQFVLMQLKRILIC